MGEGLPKQYRDINGLAVLEYTLALFCEHPAIAGVMVALAPGDPYWPKLEWAKHDRVMTTAGGRERCHSVLNCLAALEGKAAPGDWVLVHDAARPCVRRSDVDALLDAAGSHPVGGILALPVRDTMKRSVGGEISETIDRRDLWHAQTPQMFHLEALRNALDHALQTGVEVTDEAQAMELGGARPLLVAGHADNIKITNAGDLAMAELILTRSRGDL